MFRNIPIFATMEIMSTLAEKFQKNSYLCNAETLSDLFNQQSETTHPDLPVLNLILEDASQVGLVFGRNTFSLDGLFFF